MPRILKNPDGTVNLDAVNRETQFLKGKYAQNAANIEKNKAAEEQHGAPDHQQPSAAASSGDVAPPTASGGQQSDQQSRPVD
ncbi:uncharacterized protein PFL1_06830 [Pseudozyma flocculosa PF-1]|uniref:Uncharacterized protein n=1 Tax=Pseudozyma flocculosa TaxID=84751 RepID=A0A5C3ETZ3_9BASI|nr:uncharacterized protein PFL1_06830 [Pseudozyma flocculosa PF-1]EPQ32118.1 hypothetical protein PFL1_06830 [Pseudozyma flocculosa PF-1]SPO34947.1 uncharacterized protein PSFLO_00418 [Pseudozyma flocculosa]